MGEYFLRFPEWKDCFFVVMQHAHTDTHSLSNIISSVFCIVYNHHTNANGSQILTPYHTPTLFRQQKGNNTVDLDRVSDEYIDIFEIYLMNQKFFMPLLHHRLQYHTL